MKNNLFKGKSTRTKIFTVITLLGIVLLLLLNLFVYYFGVFDNAYIDMTPEGLYTLRPVMVDACRDIFLNEDGTQKEQGVKMIFCDDPDNLIANTVTRAVYYMAVALADEYSGFEVETVNIKYNPTAVAAYKTTSLTAITSDDVIITYGSRYRITSAESFWRILEDNTVYSFDGEYKLASILLSLTLINKPAAYFVWGHGEDIYDTENPTSQASVDMAYFADLLTEKGLAIKKINLSEVIAEAEANGETPKLPEDCLLLIVNDPKTDFISDASKFGSFGYVSETELLDRFVTEGKGSLMVAKDYKNILPNLEDFLSEWGISYSNTLVKDEENCIITEGSEFGTDIVGVYDTDENNYTYGIYGEYANLTSAPRMIITDTGHIECSFGDSTGMTESGTYNTSKIYVPFIYSSDGAKEYAKNSITGEYTALAKEEAETKTLAALCARKAVEGESGKDTYSYVFAAAGADFFSGKVLGNPSYANYDVTASLVQEIARLDTYADDSLGGVSINKLSSNDFGGKVMVETEIGTTSKVIYEYLDNGKTNPVRTVYGLGDGMKIVYTVVICLLPLSVAVVGIVICVKRRFL